MKKIRMKPGIVISVLISLTASASEQPLFKSQLSTDDMDAVLFSDVDGDGNPDILERWWNGKRCRWFDENDDMNATDQRGDMFGDSMQIEKEVGSIDILVNNAGIIKRIPILDMPVADYKQVIDVDLIAPFIVGKRVAPNMIKKGGGKIINMCSMMSVYGRNSVSAYASAKGGLKLLTANICCEWAKHNNQVNGIGPGYIATSQTAPIREGGHPFNDLVMMRTPAGRWGEPEDVGNAALFVASKASQFVNGHILYVDGGILANFGYVKGENEIGTGVE